MTVEEILTKQFLDSPNETNASILINILSKSEYNNIVILIGKYLSNLYQHNLNIKSNVALAAYNTKKYKFSYDLYSNILTGTNLNEKDSDIIKNKKNNLAIHITNDFIKYNLEIVNKINKKLTNHIPLITFTITTCKRFDLFEKTMNSFLNCCSDINKIDSWLCVDDNSSDEDKKKMTEKYPFFTFYFKNVNEKGHPRSMNIIRSMVKTEFIFHMEDDWQFYEKKNYISECLEVIESDNKIGQCLINKNYSETPHNNTVGGLFNKTVSGLRFFIHEYTPDAQSQQDFNKKYNYSMNCSYWPHFSFRPSLLRKNILNIIGPYDEYISHFEMDYANKYVKEGYISAFLEGTYCLHIGRLTSQRTDKNIKNAYDLNNEIQFNNKQIITKNPLIGIKTFVINLDRQTSRLNSLDSIIPIEYIRLSAIDGKKLKPNKKLEEIFEGNDHNMKDVLVGRALSHIKLYIDILEENTQHTFCILEDDITFVPDFIKKIQNIIETSKNLDWDLIYLGHDLYTEYKSEECFDPNEQNIILEKWSGNISLFKSCGGAFAYLINKKGAQKLLDFINTTGMINAIDTTQQKAINRAKLNTFYCYPHLVYSECVTVNFEDYFSLSLNQLFERTENKIKKDGKFNIDEALIY